MPSTASEYTMTKGSIDAIREVLTEMISSMESSVDFWTAYVNRQPPDILPAFPPGVRPDILLFYQDHLSRYRAALIEFNETFQKEVTPCKNP